MPMTREQLIDWLVDDTADTCRVDEGYLRSILREYRSAMDDAALEHAYHELAPDREDDDRSPDVVTLRFRPQAWIRDHAVDVDRQDPDTWTVALPLFLERFPTRQLWHDEDDERDDMRLADNAPQWVRGWSGPFEVELADPMADPWGD